MPQSRLVFDFPTSFPFVDLFESTANPAHPQHEGVRIDYQVDLDPAHSVIRVTVSARIVTSELADEVYIRLKQISSRGGPYAAIYDLSAVTDTTASTDQIRGRSKLYPAVPGDRVRVLVAKVPVIYGLSRLIELTRDFMGVQVQVVHSMEEAYELTGVRPEDFTEHLFPVDLAA